MVESKQIDSGDVEMLIEDNWAGYSYQLNLIVLSDNVFQNFSSVPAGSNPFHTF